MLLAGIGPMVRALTVDNQLIDDSGVSPADALIMAEWDAWAFTPQHYCLALGGALLLFVLYATRHKGGQLQ